MTNRSQIRNKQTNMQSETHYSKDDQKHFYLLNAIFKKYETKDKKRSKP